MALIMIIMTTEDMQVWEEMRAVLPEEVTGDWGHFVEIFGRFVLIFMLSLFLFFFRSWFFLYPQHTSLGAGATILQYFWQVFLVLLKHTHPQAQFLFPHSCIKSFQFAWGFFQVYGERFHNQQLGGWLKQRHGKRMGNHGMGTLSGSQHPRPLLLPNCKSNLQGA